MVRLFSSVELSPGHKNNAAAVGWKWEGGIRLRLSKEARRQSLRAYLQENPFVTDEALAEHFGVSVQTIRLDRAALGIPELRVRLRDAAEKLYGRVRALDADDFIGTLVALELDRRAESTLVIEPLHTFRRSRIARGHVLFAQANALTIALVDAPFALTRKVVLDYMAPVMLGDTVCAKAVVAERPRANWRRIQVRGTVGERLVYRGEWHVALFDSLEKAGEADAHRA
ncbi:MAG: transcription factor FapR [Hydrogenibacillus sp.]|nr:transcription factor FapR [Hydrogenibacillus sp.]